MDIYYNTDTKKLCDFSGTVIHTVPELSFGEKPLWNVILLRNDGSDMMIPSDVRSFKAAVSFDFNSSSEVQCRTLPESISHDGNVIHVPLDAQTVSFLDAVEGREITKGYFELSGYDSAGNKIFYLIFRINARMVLDPEVAGELPDAPESSQLTSTQLQIIMRAGEEYLFAASPDEAGHSEQMESDRYFKKRNKFLGGEWSEWIRLPDAVLREYTSATRETDGLMSAADKTKLDTLSASMIPITSAYYQTDNVDGALKEIAESLNWMGLNVALKSELINQPAGSIIIYCGDRVPDGFLLCNGAELNRQVYGNLFSAIKTIYGEGDGADTFNLPDLRGYFLEGGEVNQVGTIMEAGLPEISGNMSAMVWGHPQVYGAFTSTAVDANIQGEAGFSMGQQFVTFNASDSNPIYGKSSTVQPNAVKLNFCIRY